MLDARREVTGIGTTLCARPLVNALRIAVLAAALCGLVLFVIGMVRVPLTPSDRERGVRLGRLLRQARGDRSIVDVANAAGISGETLRKIETGRIPTPTFFTVSALALTLGLSLDALVDATDRPARDDPAA